jgi:hypothetical protein
MSTPDNTQTEDSTDRVAELTDTWESSPLTEAEQATDPRATSPADPGGFDDSKTDLQREEERTSRTDH